MDIKQKITQRLDSLEMLMQQGKHLSEDTVGEVQYTIESVSKFWSYLSFEDRDFINSVRYAVEEQLTWNP